MVGWFVLGFAGGLFFGTWLGMAILGICAAAGRAEREQEAYEAGYCDCFYEELEYEGGVEAIEREILGEEAAA